MTPVMKQGERTNYPPLGAHVSIAGGVYNAWPNAEAIDATCMQIFTANQRQWTPKTLTDDDVHAYLSQKPESAVGAVISHDSYLINLCSPDEAVQKKSMKAFADEIKRCVALKVDFLNFHPGSHKERDEDWGLKTIAEQIDRTRDLYQGTGLKLLLETTAGQGTNLGWKFEHLAKIIDFVEDDADLGVCVDTCHIFAAGYDIRNKQVWQETWSKFDDIIGLNRLMAFHLNDSKFDLGTRRDRHEEIGKGFIGLEAFRLLINDDRFKKIPMVLETPVGPDGYKDEIHLLRSLAGKNVVSGRHQSATP